MTFQHKPNTGSAFVNQRKEQPTHADYNGSCLIDGQEYWMAGWINEGGRIAWKFSKKDAKFTEPEKPTQSAPTPPDPLDDEIPF